MRNLDSFPVHLDATLASSCRLCLPGMHPDSLGTGPHEEKKHPLSQEALVGPDVHLIKRWCGQKTGWVSSRHSSRSRVSYGNASTSERISPTSAQISWL